jgi:pimeloyl-ACP methyl ester carboxylesterase
MHGYRGIGRGFVVTVPAGPGDQLAARRRIEGFEYAAELAGCLPGAEVVVLDGVGHLPNLERPDAFNEHLLRFLTRALP